MQIYKVGGAVRDRLLGREVIDRDYVVVGATVDDMLEQGFRPVGKDFPVFLHPQTQDEYALARTERKIAKGYHGFEFYTDTDVSLEDDLIRRDLTINAIAEDQQGRIYDPYHGVADLNNRILRHVSPAFAEDPLRVLRVARFAARFINDGFHIADETMALMKSLVEKDEVDALVAERVWQEIVRALSEDSPWVFFEVLRECGALARLLPEVDQLFGVPQPEQWHPEVDTGIHTMLVLKQAALLSQEPEVRFAALVHDLGKGVTPEEEWPKHRGHEEKGLPLVQAVCQRLKVPNHYKKLALLVTEFHLHFHRVFELRAATVVDLFSRLDAFRRPQRFQQFLLACESDAKGRPGYENSSEDKTQRFKDYFEAAKTVDIQEIIAKGYQGAEISEQLRQWRIRAVMALQSDS
jgi:tRNA nucleotidyltransferase (CCA-adding enzyme)